MAEPGAPDPAILAALITLAQATCANTPGLVVLGVSGAQGSGKTTAAQALAAAMAARGVATALLSLDDLYRTRAERIALAAHVHPMLITRGVPGTHDVALGLSTIAALARGAAAPLPRFDKATDDRIAPDQWPRAPARTRLLIFEGWCIGARPQPASDLITPVNALEAEHDADGRWRRHVNAALASDYALLWARIDALAMLCAPDFSTVVRWRQQQEHALASTVGDGPAVMRDDAVVRFVAHYERITRHLLTDLPARADLVLTLDRDRRVQA